MENLINYIDFIIFGLLVCLGYGAGTFAERRHYRSIEQREQELINLPVVTGEEDFLGENAGNPQLVTGSVVVSIDYFKRLLAILRNLFGGRVTSYESLVDRARREAVLRLKEEAVKSGADIVINLRLETAAIGFNANHKRQVGSIEAIAYGTALRY
ncbi:MAG: YbjQ family protein [Desulfobulbaceae bacterium]|nr:MAG: YbjQ family protein [Desulfobulbaceae bacterium]